MPELAEVEITRRKLLPLVAGRRILDFWTDRKRGLRIAKSEAPRPYGRGIVLFRLRRKTRTMQRNPPEHPLSLSELQRTPPPHSSTGFRPWLSATAGKKQIAKSIRGRKVLDVTRRGKVIFFKLSGRPERILAVHLGMSGRLAVEAAKGTKVTKGAKDVRWIHFWWRLSGGKILQFIDPRKFGRVWYGSPEDFSRDKYLGRLGRDARSLPLGEFNAVLRSGRGMLKPFLLRQDKFSGIGNIIADESLWRAKIHPGINIAGLENPQITALYRAIQKTIAAMLSSGGTSLRNWGHPDGRMGGYQECRLIYGKAGEPCPRCGRKLQRIIVGGRGTTVCPKCQRL